MAFACKWLNHATHVKCSYSNTSIRKTVSVPWEAFLLDQKLNLSGWFSMINECLFPGKGFPRTKDAYSIVSFDRVLLCLLLKRPQLLWWWQSHGKGCHVWRPDVLLYRYGIMGVGAICHTLNPRLFPEDIVYIAGHAEDKVLMFDLTFLKLIEAVKPKLTSVEAFIIMTDRQHMPKDYNKVMSSYCNLLTCF